LRIGVPPQFVAKPSMPGTPMTYKIFIRNISLLMQEVQNYRKLSQVLNKYRIVPIKHRFQLPEAQDGI
jgi:hypothetical protein